MKSVIWVLMAVMGASLTATLAQAPEVDAAVATPDVSGVLRRQQERLDELKRLRDERLEKIRKFQAEQLGEVKERKEDVQERHKKFQEEAAKLKDERQREVALRAAERFNTLNQRRVGLYEKYLDHLTLVLDKIEQRTSRIESEGANVTDVRAAIAAARTSIDAAEAAVAAQKAKEYAATIKEGQKLGEALRDLVHPWRDDHQALHQGPLRAAREAVHNAQRELAEAHGTLPTPSTSPTPTVTVSPVI